MYAFYSRMKKCVEQEDGDTYVWIANYLLQHHKTIAQLSINELAVKCHTSPATITRFCKQVNLSDFKQLKDDCLEYSLFLEQKGNRHQETNDLYDLDFIQYQQDVLASLNETFGQLDEAKLLKSASWIAHAESIGFFGSSFSNFIAKSTSDKFIRVGKKCRSFSTYDDQLWEAQRMTEKDLAIIISFSGKTELIVRILRVLKKNQVPLIFITSSYEIEQTKVLILPVSRLNYSWIEVPLIEESTLQVMMNILYMQYLKYTNVEREEVNCLD